MAVAKIAVAKMAVAAAAAAAAPGVTMLVLVVPEAVPASIHKRCV